MLIKIFNEERKIDKPCRVMDLIENENRKYICAKVNNRVRELTYIIDKDCEIEPLDLTDGTAMRIYQSSLRLVVIMAFRNIFPKAKVIFNYSVSRSIFGSVSNLGHAFLQQNLKAIQEEMDRIIAADYPLERRNYTKEEAAKIYEEEGLNDKLALLKHRKEDVVHMTYCNGYLDYMYSYTVPSTGYLKKYALRLYAPGFLLSYPRAELNGEIPPFQDESTFRKSLKEANQWGNVSSATYISQMNDIITSGSALEFINICEHKHNRQFAQLGEAIVSNIERIRLICVAGPSSSGKTTFTNRLKIELKSRGVSPLMISIDDFYKKPEEAPLDENGRPDFEHIDALDRELFDEIIYRLIQGDDVKLPIYNFKKHEREWGEPVKLKPKQVIMIEGIHALNDALTPSISAENKFKIYIAPLGQYHIDDHTPISISDLRLIRRMVRDHSTRNTGCEATLAQWSSVRAGEFKWIYPNEASADFIFNSELTYELCVMKKHAVPLLQAVPTDSPWYIDANRLLKFLKYFEDISDKWIPCNSIIREFVGGSIFYTEDKK